MEPVGIRLDNVSKTFSHRVKGQVAAVNRVSLDIAPGELLTLLGPSGCGKTTTLRMVAGFERPDAGRIFIGGEDVTDLLANRRHLGFVFQNYALFPHLSIFENAAYGLRVKGLAEGKIRDEVAQVLDLVGLKGYERQFPHQLSGGEQQRVALARAVIIQPRVLLFDEPLSNLDAKLRVHMRSELRRLQKRLTITSVYVTHDQEEAMAISDRIAVMTKGRIAQIGSAQELYLSPRTPFVAGFIGKTNVLPARVIQVSGETASLEALGRMVQVAVTGRRLSPGQAVSLFLRPESIQVGPPRQGQSFEGEVVEQTFLGEKVEYLVEAAGQRLQATTHDPWRGRTFAPGEAVSLDIPAPAFKILEEEE